MQNDVNTIILGMFITSKKHTKNELTCYQNNWFFLNYFYVVKYKKQDRQQPVKIIWGAFIFCGHPIAGVQCIVLPYNCTTSFMLLSCNTENSLQSMLYIAKAEESRIFSWPLKTNLKNPSN